jgi:hypothetical protein
MRLFCLFAALWVGATLPLPAADFTMEKTEVSPPEEAAQAVREVMASGALEVSTGDGVLARFWFRGEIPMRDSPSGELGVSFGRLEQGVLMGIVQFTRPWRDYKNLAIETGVYTLRYGIEPQDGNHMGVSIYRDFLLLIPVAEDRDVDVTWDADELYAESSAATGQPHPGVLALFPIYDEISEPKITMNDMSQPTLAVKLGSLTLGLVIEGHGEI